jgi:hypothetical protein
MDGTVERNGGRVTCRVGSWSEWRLRCALALCRDEVRRELAEFAGYHFQRMVRRYAHRFNVTGPGMALRDEDCWHLFETYFTLRSARDGKRHKEWMFERAVVAGSDAQEALAGGAVVLLRDVVREHLRREHTPASFFSLNSPAEMPGESGLTLEDLLPGSADPASETADRELEAIARDEADGLLQDMTEREKIAVAAKHAGLSLAHPGIERAAGCRKSALHSTYRAFVLRVTRRLRAGYREDDPSVLRLLIVRTLNRVGDVAGEWAVSELRWQRVVAEQEPV